MGEKAVSYDAARIELLEGREAIRKRPGMYIGSTGQRGLHHLVFELVTPAVADVLAGRASRVDVVLLPDGGVRVSDDGPGEGPGEALLTYRYHDPEVLGREDVSVGVLTVGLFVANVLSRRMTVEVRRDGARWVQEYERGVALGPLTETGPAAGTGTTLTCRPDADVFETLECSSTALAERFRELAFLHEELDISLTDARSSDVSVQEDRFRFAGGLRDFVAHLDAQREARPEARTDIIGFAWEDPRMAGTAEVALRWSGSGDERIASFANSRRTWEGGTHAAGLRDGIAAAVDAYAREHGLAVPAADRIGRGLTAAVAVRLDRCEFEGCTRTGLANPEVRACVAEAVREHLGAWLEAHPGQAHALVGSACA
ncbi:DNA gyrase subunit B [Streptomyces sp. NPDC048604]|uniref:DNA gyrase subunit B n=1 Tax=Streptomyces sp. NPDC048604 TaxID=3365578 RepID=UPI00371F504E